MSKASYRQTPFCYRLNEFGITLPPLRERDDILHLANKFLREAGMELGRPCRKISEAAAEILLRYHWPGNVRELRNVIRRAILLASDVIEPEHLAVLPVDPPPTTVDTALRGESAPAGSSLREIAGGAAAYPTALSRAIWTATQAATSSTAAPRAEEHDPGE